MTSGNNVLSTTKVLISATVHECYKFKGFDRLVIKLFLQVKPLCPFSHENSTNCFVGWELLAFLQQLSKLVTALSFKESKATPSTQTWQSVITRWNSWDFMIKLYLHITELFAKAKGAELLSGGLLVQPREQLLLILTVQGDSHGLDKGDTRLTAWWPVAQQRGQQFCDSSQS